MAYYGLYGNKIFDDFEKDVLKRDIQKDLVSGLLNPLNWFKFTNSGFDRTELAINYYDEHIFKGATFADFRKDMPFIQINATDMSGGQSFISYIPRILRRPFLDFMKLYPVVLARNY
ncbi:MAG: hypothetical protein GY784_16470 [Gammaproteobacteria bacterium]|nr:hypothetical protein [Gammaproteobacteria bacterium]